MKTIAALIINANDLQARRISASENLQREDLSAIEKIEAIVEIVDAELIEDKEYLSMGDKPADRVKTLLGKLHSLTSSKNRGSQVSGKGKSLLRKFAQQVEKIFQNLPKPLEWRSFYRHDLPLLMDFCEEVREASMQYRLNRSQTRALEKLKSASIQEFQRVTAHARRPGNWETEQVGRDSSQIGLRDLSGREIEELADKAARKESLSELKRSRVSPYLSLEVQIFLMSRLGITLNRIATRLKIDRKSALKHSENYRLFRSIRSALKKGKLINQVSKEQGCPESLVWSIALEGKTDQERFKALNWGLRTWDLWYWNVCDNRFGDDWPGRVPAQMIAHILYYFSSQGDLVLDPMAGGGVVADTCLAFNRKCWSFDMDDRPDTRPEIEPHFWHFNDLKWSVQGKAKPDLIIFDPPYFKKQADNYDKEAISGLSKEEYLEFLESFFALAHQNAKKSTQMAFINADWRDFQNTPAKNETRVNSILINDYLRILNQNGWQETHIIRVHPEFLIMPFVWSQILHNFALDHSACRLP